MRLFFVLLLSLFLVRPLGARIYVDITGPSSTKVGVALSLSGYPVKGFDVTLKRDLFLYGIFVVYPVDRLHLSPDRLSLVGADLYLGVEKSVFGDRLKVAYVVKDVTDDVVIKSAVLEGDRTAAVKMAHMIADTLYQAVTGNRGMFSRRAVAFRKVLGGYELVLLDVGAMRYRKLYFFKKPAQSPSLSPDGKRVVFSFMGGGDFDIYLLDITTGKLKRVCGTKGPDTAPQWFPDGRRIVFAGTVGDNTDIFECDVETGRLKRITRSISIDTMPTVSPDGEKVAFVSNRAGHPNIYIKELSTGLEYRVTTGSYDVSPSWSPKGDAIAFSSIVDGTNMVGVYNINTGVVRYMARGEDPTWSPNGDYLLYVRGTGLYMVPVYGSAGSGVRLFVGRWINPCWR